MSIKRLKDDQYYSDLYDQMTIENCLFLEKSLIKSDKISKKHNLSEHGRKSILELLLYYEKGEQYRKKSEAIQKWMDNDRKADDHYENTPEPANICCKFCDNQMEMIYKGSDYSGKSLQIYFFYVCRDCRVNKKIWENGIEEDHIPWKCPKCSRKLLEKDKREGNKIISEKDCSFCGYNDVSALDLSEKKPEKEDPNKIKEFRINKDRFCLSEKEGAEYVRFLNCIKTLESLENERKKNKQSTKKQTKLLTVPQLERNLSKIFGSEKYGNLKFENIDTSADVIVSFSIQDPTKRTAYSSRSLLKKLIKKALDGTNWKLMSEGIGYKLGVLAGRLRGVEDNAMSFKNIIY